MVTISIDESAFLFIFSGFWKIVLWHFLLVNRFGGMERESL